MASLYDWKPAFQERLRPYAEQLHDNGITPNQVTLAALALSAIEGALLLAWPGAWLPLLLLPLLLLNPCRRAFSTSSATTTTTTSTTAKSTRR